MNFNKTKEELSKAFWDNKYLLNKTGWDIGYVSTPLKEYIDPLTDKEINILIPGGGNSYEAEYFYNKGFKNVSVLDISLQPLENIKNRLPYFPQNQLIYQDFFNHNKQYDLIIEQTFFCALHPTLRKDYVKKMHTLLKPNGKIAGLLFNFELTPEGPPFGGSLEEYLELFSKNFKIKKLEKCYNSIEPRKGRELFFIFEKNIENE